MLAEAMISLMLHASVALVQAEPAASAAAPAAAKVAEAPPPPFLPGGTGFMPPEWSTAAPTVDNIYYFITWLSLFFFVLITVLTVYFAIKYRQKDHAIPAGGPTHHTPLELTWSIIPLLIAIAIFYVGMKGYVSLRTVPIDAYTVNVTAQKWSWTFEHPNGANEVGLLRIPAGRPVRLVLRSEDVIHALYIPAFRLKQDVVPGRLGSLWFEAQEPPNGEPVVQTDLFCAEYCGTGHSEMFAHVYIYRPDVFQKAIDEAANWIKGIPDEDLWYKAGPRIYQRCASCHSLEEGKILTGPSFRDVWKEVSVGNVKFASGQELKNIMGEGMTYSSPEDYIQQSILFPQKDIVEGFPSSMPTFKGQLKDREILAMIHFLQNIDKFDDQGKLKEPIPAAGGAPG